MSKYGLPAQTVEVENHVGHWAIGTGASRLVDEVRESRKIAYRVHSILQAAKVPSTYFQDEKSTNKDQNLKTLVAHHNADTNGLVVAWHLNATSGTVQDGIGTEVLYANPKWKALAEALSAAIAKAGGFKNRGAKLNNKLYVLNSTKEPAILVETFFVNSQKDVDLYNKNFEAICQAAASVLAEAVGKKVHVAPAPSPVPETIVKPMETIAKETFKKEAIAEIKAAAKDGRFTSPHPDVEKYTEQELQHFMLVALARRK